jgi:hypothetical protein
MKIEYLNNELIKSYENNDKQHMRYINNELNIK